MTLRQLIDATGEYPAALIALAVLPAVLTLALRLLHTRDAGGQSPWRYAYAVLVYVVCVPGMFAALLTGYVLLFTGDSLLDVNFLIYGAPIISMVATLVIMSRNVQFEQIPGFGRLSGLMVMLGVSFAIVLALSKTRIFLFFGAPLAALIALAVGAFALVKWGAYMAFRRGSDPTRTMPGSD